MPLWLEEKLSFPPAVFDLLFSWSDLKRREFKEGGSLELRGKSLSALRFQLHPCSTGSPV
jgi:hypothetical protein